MNVNQIRQELDRRIYEFRQNTARDPELIVISEIYLIELQRDVMSDSKSIYNNLLKYYGIEVRSTIKPNVIGVF